jgi:hypothetical protein
MDAETNIRAANGPKGKRRDRRTSSSDFAEGQVRAQRSREKTTKML